MKLIKSLIESNIFISLAAVFLTLESQVLLGMEPQWHPYLFIIFFATLFEYNLHRFITSITNKEALLSEKYTWVRENLKAFYVLVFLSLVGFMVVVFMAKKEVLLALAPIAVLTLLYSIPVFGNQHRIFRLRDIPYLKIFLIAFVWSVSTILLPIIQAQLSIQYFHVGCMLIERFLFVFAIALPFDIRDYEADKQAGLKTIPILIEEKKAFQVSYLILLLFWTVSLIHYALLQSWFIVPAMSLSALTTGYFLYNKKIRNIPYYHYGILDGTMLLQGALVLIFYYL